MNFEMLTKLLVEMPVTTVKKLGPESDWKNRGSYDKGSYLDIQNPEFENKVKSAFKGVDEYIDLNFYFINNKEFSDDSSENNYSESGEVSNSHPIWKFSGIDYNEVAPDPNADAISIVFVGNTGSDLVKMTPWVLAHRMGHAFRASRNNWSISQYFSQIEEQLVMAINIALEDYGIRHTVKRFTDYKSNKYIIPVLNAMGRFRSARMNKIDRPYEFIYECFAEYLITGSIKFNKKLRPISISYDEFEDPDLYKYSNSDDGDLESFSRSLEYLFDELLRSAIGSVFVM